MKKTKRIFIEMGDCIDSNQAFTSYILVFFTDEPDSESQVFYELNRWLGVRKIPYQCVNCIYPLSSEWTYINYEGEEKTLDARDVNEVINLKGGYAWDGELTHYTDQHEVISKEYSDEGNEREFCENGRLA